MELTTCARPYARAAFEYAKNADALGEWETMLLTCVKFVGQSRVAQALDNPVMTVQQQADLFISLAKGLLNQDMENFVRMLSEHHRYSVMPEIYGLFKEMKAREEKTQEVDVISAFALTDSQQQQLIIKMEARLGCRVTLKPQIDKSLIGGLIIKAGDLVIDGSVKARLTKLASAMVS
ncbi:ATP synthase subunit delta [invertebrate metagenome]|uniref:ATP synthase subunit delta n=1 Tax=invertebrate metagenome TaxID=1711999 RepID=A0A2H9TBR4_9ZZZZ